MACQPLFAFTYLYKFKEFYGPSKDAFLHDKTESLSFGYNKNENLPEKINMISRFSMQNSNREC